MATIENLKRGNTVNVGRKRNAVKMTLASGAVESAKYINDVAKGKRVVLVPPNAGEDPTYRYPTEAEREWAIAQQMKYGVGTSDEVDVTSNGEQMGVVVYIPSNGRD